MESTSAWAIVEDSETATISLLAMIALCIIATVAIACAVHQRAKRSHGRGRRNSHEELYTNVNAGRGGYDLSTTSTKPALTKKQSEVGAALAPSSPTFVRGKEAGGSMQSTKLDDGFFDLGGGLGGRSPSKMPPRLKKQPSSGTSMKSSRLDDSFFSGSSDSIGGRSTKSQSFGPPAI